MFGEHEVRESLGAEQLGSRPKCSGNCTATGTERMAKEAAPPPQRWNCPAQAYAQRPPEPGFKFAESEECNMYRSTGSLMESAQTRSGMRK